MIAGARPNSPSRSLADPRSRFRAAVPRLEFFLMLVEVPIHVWRRANDPAVIWRFRAEGSGVVPLADRYELVIDVPGQSGAIVHSTDGPNSALSIDRVAGTVTWTYTIAESSQLPIGDRSRYELMGITADRTRAWAGGRVVARSWRS